MPVQTPMLQFLKFFSILLVFPALFKNNHALFIHVYVLFKHNHTLFTHDYNLSTYSYDLLE